MVELKITTADDAKTGLEYRREEVRLDRSRASAGASHSGCAARGN
jgi:hypothetical protein